MKTRRDLLESVQYDVRYAYDTSNDPDTEELLLKALATVAALLKMEKAEAEVAA